MNRVKDFSDMNKLLLLRLCAAILVLSFVFGLPMQGTVMASQMSLAAAGDVPMPDDCGGCGDDPVMKACPVLVCVGFSAVVLEKQEFKQASPESASAVTPDTGAGLSRRPDPYPPRSHFLS